MANPNKPITEADSSLQLGDIADEFFDQVGATGQQPNVDEFAKQHPKFADLIRELFPALVLIGKIDRPGSNFGSTNKAQDIAGNRDDAFDAQ
jgi:hypothetical protein